MVNHSVFPSVSNKENPFRWYLGSGQPILASRAFFEEQRSPLRHDWFFFATTGTPAENNIFSFGIFIPYEDVDLLEKTYTLANGLSFIHGHSKPEWYGAQDSFLAEKKAELSVRLDRIKGTAVGDFNGEITTDCYQLKLTGTFDFSLTSGPRSESGKTSRKEHFEQISKM
jgi:hypothetical protein